MKTYIHAFVVFTFVACFGAPIFAQGTAFTYQGQLQSNGAPANGIYNLTFSLFTTNTGGSAVAGPVTNSGVTISNGLFTVMVDFGGSWWNGETNWLQIGVETNGGSSFTPLSPRQQVTPTPYAIYAEGANAAGLSGTVPMSSLSGTYGGTLNLTSPANSFAGNGAGLTNLNAATLGGLAASNFWQLGGNASVPNGSNIIGANGNQYLDLHANGVRALRLRVLSDGMDLYTNAPNLIGGSSVNVTAPNVVGATIAGGGGQDTNGISYPNDVAADFGTIGGGASNYAGYQATVGGGLVNAASYNYTTVAGGNGNTASSWGATVGGGVNNSAVGVYGYVTVGGGYGNYASGTGSFIGGGGCDGSSFSGNNIQALAAVIGGGLGNQIPSGANYAVIGGGLSNYAGFQATVGGGLSNTASYNYTTVAGGNGNTASSWAATVGGGEKNSAVGVYGYVTVGGGYSNYASGAGSFIGGGGIDGSTFAGNNIQAVAAVIGGGLGNIIPSGGSYAVIGGGNSNNASGTGAFIGGGGYDGESYIPNNAAGIASVIGGGIGNTNRGSWGTIAGGLDNLCTSAEATVGGGVDNTAGGEYATVCGGQGNNASGSAATVCGGFGNSASGNSSFAAGYDAQAIHDNAFVWSDGEGGYFNSDRAEQFKIQAGGGVYMAVSGSSGLKPAACEINSSSAAGVGLWVTQSSSDATAVLGNGGTGDLIKGFSGASQGTLVFEVLNDGTVKSKGMALTSDRNAKENYAPLDAQTVLAKVAALPVTEWNYKDDPADKKHIGPVAQDFHTAFGLDGSDDRHISVVDEGGVALAAIQGLNQKVESENAALRAENADLKARLQKIEKLIYANQGTKNGN